MKNYIALLFFIFIIFSLSKQSYSGDYAGADLTYTCLGGDNYRITFSFYKDCNCPVSVPANAQIKFLCSLDSLLNFDYNLTLVPGTGQEVSQSCSVIPSRCNSGTNYGVREYVYQGVVTLTKCNKWTMSYSRCCRNPATTVPNNSYNHWYIQAELDNYNAPSNSSPSFANKPIVVVLTNQPYYYKNFAFDPDGDSLVYSFYTPYRTGPTASVVYAPPFTVNNFLISNLPISLDPTTGDIRFTSTVDVSTITGIKVEEWRKINGVPTLIGSVHRDIQLKTYTHIINKIPTLSGIDLLNTHTYNPNDTTFYIETCAGSSINFDINGHDSDVYNPLILGRPDIFYISWNQGIPLGSFTTQNNGTDSAYAHFSWTPTSADVSNLPKCFIAKIHDEYCPYYGSQIFKYCIKVKPPINPPFIGNDTNICVNHNLPLDAGIADSYLWFNGDTTQTTLVDASTLGVGNHQIVVNITKNGCTASDTLNLTIDPCLGFEKLEESFDFQINPNPSTGQFYLTLNKNIVSPVKLEIYSPLGQTVLRKEIPISNQNTISFELNNVSKGVYYIKLISEKTTLTKTIIIR